MSTADSLKNLCKLSQVCSPLNRSIKFDWSSIALTLEEVPARSEWTEPTDLQWLDSITSLACMGVLDASNDEDTPRLIELCKVMLVHVSLIAHLPLEHRALNVKFDQGSEIIQSFLNSYFCTLSAILERYNFGQASLVDIFDGRLFSSLLVFFANHEYLKPEDILADAEYTKLENIWTLIAGSGSSVIPRIDFVKGVCEATVPLVANNQMITCDSVVKSIVLPEPIGTEGREFQPPRQIVEFSEDHHWHSNKPLKDTLWALARNDDPVQSKDRWRLRKENRSIQKYYHFITR